MAKLIKQLPQKNPHLNNHQQKNPNQAKPQLLSGNVPLPWWIPQGAEVWNLWKCLFTPLSLNKWDQIGSCWHWLSSFPLQWERLWFLILTSSFFLTLVWFYFWWEVHNDYNEINWWVELPPNFLIIFFFLPSCTCSVQLWVCLDPLDGAVMREKGKCGGKWGSGRAASAWAVQM